jgi:hypothetical protein
VRRIRARRAMENVTPPTLPVVQFNTRPDHQRLNRKALQP